MTVPIALQLPKALIEQAQRLGAATQRDAATVLAESLQLLWLSGSDLPHLSHPPVSQLSDADLLALADSKLDPAQNQRLGDLQAKGKTTALSDAERYELAALLQIYQLGQLRKSQALAAAVQRGLRPPLAG